MLCGGMLPGDEVARLGSVLGVAHRCATTGAGVCFRLGVVIMRQYTEAFGIISGLHARVRCSYLEMWSIM